MKQMFIWIFFAVCIAATNSAMANDGERLFKSQGCLLCHKKDNASTMNPSLTEISRAYHGKEDQLIKYLRGDAEAIVRPKQSGLMKRQVEKTKKLSDADLKSLAGYLLHQN